MKLQNLITTTTAAQIKAQILGIAKIAKLPVDAWFPGDPSLVIITVIAQIIYLFSISITDAIRSQFLEFATDPGDDGKGTPGSGWLSQKGEGDYYTKRLDATFAIGSVTLTNGSNQIHTFGPEDLTLQNRNTAITYRNVYDPILYPEPNRLFTLTPGASVTIPIKAEEQSSGGNAVPGEITILVSGLTGVTVTNEGPVIGTDREPREEYVARCRIAASATSPNGPADAYRYLATSARSDGTFGQSTTGTRLNVTRVQVTKDSATGLVDVWFASPAGAADPGEFTIANTIIQLFAVPDCVTYTGHNAIEEIVDIMYIVEAIASPGLTEQILKDAIAARLADFFPTIPIGGFKNDGTFGKLFVARIRAEIIKAHPAIFDGFVGAPVGNMPILNGHVGRLGAINGTVHLT